METAGVYCSQMKQGETMNKTVLFLMLSFFFATLVFSLNCGPQKTEPVEKPVPAKAIEVKEIDTETPPPRADSENKSKDERFKLVVQNALLFDTGSDSFAGNLTQEKGVCLLIIGAIRNDTGRMFHRGGLFGTLTTSFGEEVVIKKHSGGMGFLPEVSSEEPWRPGDWRNFRLITRALDPIYIEYKPKKITAEIVLEVRDPLNFRLRKTLSEFSVSWSTLIGAGIEGTVAVVEKITPINFEKAGAKRFSPGDLVKVTFQKGSGYKVLADDGSGGWMPYRSLSLDKHDFNPFLERKPPVQVKSDGIAVNLSKMSRVRIKGKEKAVYTLDLEIENLHEKVQFQVRASDMIIDFGPTDAPIGKLFVRKEDGYSSTSGITLKPGKKADFRYVAENSISLPPFEWVWWVTSKTRIAAPLR